LLFIQKSVKAFRCVQVLKIEVAFFPKLQERENITSCSYADTVEEAGELLTDHRVRPGGKRCLEDMPEISTSAQDHPSLLFQGFTIISENGLLYPKF